MDLHQRQQFDLLLAEAARSLVARLVERGRGPDAALVALTEGGEDIDRFVAALFRDALLDNVDGACFILRALPRRAVPAGIVGAGEAGTVEQVLDRIARRLFADLVRTRAVEMLEQATGYQPIDTESPP